MLKLTLLVSGGLGFEIIKHVANNRDVKIVSVFTDYESQLIIDYVNNNNIKLFKGNPRKYNDKLKSFLVEVGESDLILSVNYLFIINKELIAYPKLYALNIHGSLLPKYRGRTPHVWAIINGEIETGVTVHRINEGVDTGDILIQKKVKIEQNDTGFNILQKYNLIYPKLVEESINLIINKNKVKFIKQDCKKATYYGKRTPDNGKINWHWSKERIYNWVRAQSNPYPGAFTFYRNEKIIIDKIEYSDYGFNYKDENGKIVNSKNLIIKVTNGAIKILEYRVDNEIEDFQFEEGIILGSN